MGGYRSGGHNRIYNHTGEHKRFDSFDISGCVQMMRKKNKVQVNSSLTWGNGNEIYAELFLDYLVLKYVATDGDMKENVCITIYLDAVTNNYGGERVYFRCPYCGRRSRYLYLIYTHFKCRKCARLNYRSQQLTKNEDAVAYRMRKLLRDKFKVTEKLASIDMQVYEPERPKGMHWSTHERLRAELHELQGEYSQGFMKKMLRVLGWLL